MVQLTIYFKLWRLLAGFIFNWLSTVHLYLMILTSWASTHALCQCIFYVCKVKACGKWVKNAICPGRTQWVYSCKAYDWSVVTDRVLYNHWALHLGFQYTSWKSNVRNGQRFEQETFINDWWQFFNVDVYVRFCLRCHV